MRSEIIRGLSELHSGCCSPSTGCLWEPVQQSHAEAHISALPAVCRYRLARPWGWSQQPKTPHHPAQCCAQSTRGHQLSQLSPCFLKSVAAASEAASLSPVVPARVQTFPPWQGVVGGGAGPGDRLTCVRTGPPVRGCAALCRTASLLWGEVASSVSRRWSDFPGMNAVRINNVHKEYLAQGRKYLADFTVITSLKAQPRSQQSANWPWCVLLSSLLFPRH